MEEESLSYLDKTRTQLSNLSPINTVELVYDLVKEHETWIDRSCLNLNAASNMMSPRARALLSSTIATRVVEGHPGSKHQKGVKYLERIEAIVIELAKKLFEASFAECRVLSGSMANLIAFNSLLSYGDTIMALSVPSGGHISYRKFGAAGYKGLNVESIPFDDHKMNIDVEKLAEVAVDLKPKLILLGASLILFPFPVRDVRKIADDVGAYLMYDGAHVEGLIAGGQFQEPLKEGVDVFTSSTYKTLGGPPGGLILCNEERVAEKIDKSSFPGLTANIHYHRLAATAVTLAELLQFGRDYASDVVRNAKVFGKALDDEGFDVVTSHMGYTMSHQVAVDVSSLGGGDDTANLLEKANIICNSNLLPWDQLKMLRHPSGIRLGVQEITKLGMKEAEMKEIAYLFRQVLIDKKNPEVVRNQVDAFRENYNKIHYCFEPE